MSRRLGNALKLPVIHLDTLFWKPGWIEPNKEEWAETIGVQRIADLCATLELVRTKVLTAADE